MYEILYNSLTQDPGLLDLVRVLHENDGQENALDTGFEHCASKRFLTIKIPVLTGTSPIDSGIFCKLFPFFFFLVDENKFNKRIRTFSHVVSLFR